MLYGRLRRFAGVVRPWTMEADDLVQEALARTLASRRLSELEWPEAYLRRAILRVALNEQRGRRRFLSRLSRLGSSSNVVADEYPSDLRDLTALSPRVRAVLYLHVVEDLSYDDVASTLGCRPEAARKAGSRGLGVLRAALVAEEGEFDE